MNKRKHTSALGEESEEWSQLVVSCFDWSGIKRSFREGKKKKSGFFFLMWTIVKDFIEFVTILLLFYVLVFWLWGRWVGILAPAWPGNEPRVPALEGKVLTTGLPGKSSGSSKKTKKGFLHSVLKATPSSNMKGLLLTYLSSLPHFHLGHFVVLKSF